MRALAKAWRFGAFMNRTGTARRSAPAASESVPPGRATTRPRPSHPGLTARELIRMAQAARLRRD